MVDLQSKQSVLCLLDKGKIVETIILQKSPLTIGRDNCDLVLEESAASLSHCQIQYLNNSYHLFDLNSTNGTFLNGSRIIKSKLSMGDKIRIGATEFIFKEENSTNNSTIINVEDECKVLIDYHTLPSPTDKIAKEIDELLEVEQQYLLSTLQVIITATYADGISEQFVLNTDLQVGRASNQGRFLKDEEMSRKHARFFRGDNIAGCSLEDLGSTNGVFVNNKRIAQTTKITELDIIKIGQTTFVMSVKV